MKAWLSVAIFATLYAQFLALPSLAAPASKELEKRVTYAGYAFVYFTGENTSNGEQIFFAVSQGIDPLHWNTVHGGTPVLTATLGTGGVRDPYIIRSPAGDKFFLIATDLRFYVTNNWDTASRHGSRSLAIWDSTDLIHWSAQRLIQVSPPEAGNTWAPEAIWDPTTSQYIVFWASKLFATSDPNHTGSGYNHIMYATTKDFWTFSTAKVWIDRGVEAIDTTVIWDATSGYYHRFTKTAGAILQEKSTTFFGTWTTVTNGIGTSVIGESEGPTIFDSVRYPGVYHLFLDDLSPRGYIPFETQSIGSGVWTKSVNYALPTSPRHGTAFPVTAAEQAALAAL